MKYLVCVLLSLVSYAAISQVKTDPPTATQAPDQLQKDVYDTLKPLALTKFQEQDIRGLEDGIKIYRASAEAELNARDREFKALVHGIISGHNIKEYDGWVMRDGKLYIYSKRKK